MSSKNDPDDIDAWFDPESAGDPRWDLYLEDPNHPGEDVGEEEKKTDAARDTGESQSGSREVSLEELETEHFGPVSSWWRREHKAKSFDEDLERKARYCGLTVTEYKRIMGIK